MQNLVYYKIIGFLKVHGLPLPGRLISYLCLDRVETSLIIDIRDQVFDTLVSRGAISSEHKLEDKDYIMVRAMFEHCGVVASAMESVLRDNIGIPVFMFHSVHGHHVIKSKVTGLLYDMVTTKGVSDKRDLDYAKYIEKISNGDENAIAYFVKMYSQSTQQ